jgi:hypothetical protein
LGHWLFWLLATTEKGNRQKGLSTFKVDLLFLLLPSRKTTTVAVMVIANLIRSITVGCSLKNLK